MNKIILSILTCVCILFLTVSCMERTDDKHTHSYIDGVCECGQSDPDYTPPHKHSFTEGKCECGAIDPTYEPPHVHEGGAPVSENVVAADCSKSGSFDEVVYCSSCGAELSRTSKVLSPLGHSFVDGICECGAENPDYFKPTYKTEYRKNLSGLTIHGAGEDIIKLVDFIGALNSHGVTVYGFETDVSVGNITVGRVEGFSTNEKAYAELEKLERTSYFTVRYAIYVENGDIAIAYDKNEYTPLSALDGLSEHLIKEIIVLENSIAFEDGLVKTGTVDLKEIQKALDRDMLDDIWAEVEGKTTSEIYSALRQLYSMYDESLIEWYANLYDPATGLFYQTTSERTHPVIFPILKAQTKR